MMEPLERTIESATSVPTKLEKKAREVSWALTSGLSRLAERRPTVERTTDETRDGLHGDLHQRRRRARTLHVEPHGGGWAVRLQGTGEIARVTSARDVAHRSAERWAAREGRRLFLHRDDGTIERIRCFSGSNGDKKKR